CRRGEDEPLRTGPGVLPGAIADLRRCPDEVSRLHEIGERAEHELELVLLLARARLVLADGQADVAGPDDRLRVAALLGAPVVQRSVTHGVELWREERHVPSVGVARNHAQQAALALPADP